MTQYYLRLWLLVCAGGAIGCGVAALNWMNIAQSLVLTDGAVGSPVFWNAYLRFQFWAFLSVFALLVGLVSAVVAVVLPRLSAPAGLPTGRRAPR